MVKVPQFVRDVIAVIAILFLLTVPGLICMESGVMGNYPPVTTRFVFQVLALDQNGTYVPNQTVYAIACVQKPASLLASTWYVDNVGLAGTTDKDGFVEIETGNITLARGDIIWMGVSTNESLLESDLGARTFSPGQIGKWGRYNYSDVASPGAAAKWGRSMLVRNSDGRMIDINEFNKEAGFFAVVSSISYFSYMDNRSWAYPIPYLTIGEHGCV